MMDYYLPTTSKLLDAYRELDKQPVAGDNIRSTKAEIEQTVDTLNVAFEKTAGQPFCRPCLGYFFGYFRTEHHAGTGRSERGRFHT